MPTTIKDIEIEDVQDLFDSVIFLRGEEYFEDGAVESIDAVDSSTITGTVTGNDDYNVTVSIDSAGDIICDCTCPCDFNCKHAAALLLNWLSIKDKYSRDLKAGKKLLNESIPDILSKKSKEELVELIQTFLNKHPELKSFVKIEKKEIISKMKRLFSHFWEWNQVQDLISQLETILEGIKRNKNLWNNNLLNEMKICSDLMIEGQNSVHDDGDLGIFLEDWFMLYGEVFSATKPSIEEKKAFMQGIMDWIDNDDYGFESSFEKAFLGMCTSKEDIELIKEFYKPSQQKDEEHYEGEEDDYQQFYLELYDKIGMNDKYLDIAKNFGFNSEYIDKLISLNKLEQALEACNKAKNKDENSLTIEYKKIEILKKLDRNEEAKRAMLDMIKETGQFHDVAKLKKESSKEEWQGFLKKIIADAKKKKRSSLLSRIYYHENDYKTAYEYSKSMRDADYMELLAKKLTTNHSQLACNLFKKLCFNWIDRGSGWPYKKAGKMLEAIKKLDKKGNFFARTKEEVTAKHKKKYSLMEIINQI